MMKPRMMGLELSDEDAPLLEQLPINYQEILRIAAVHKSSCNAMADAMGINIGTVKSRLNRAKNALEALRPKKVQAA